MNRDPMNRRSFLKATSAAGLACGIPSTVAFASATEEPALPPGTPQKKVIPPDSPERILLKDYRPKSIYKIPVTEVAKAKYPIIDMHSHPYAKTPAANCRMAAQHGRGRRRKNDDPDHGDRRGVRCHQPQLFKISRPLRALVRLRFLRLQQTRLRPRRPSANWNAASEPAPAASARFTTKAKACGQENQTPPACIPTTRAWTPLFEKIAELGMPISLHVADPIWMYQKMDNTNDGLMNA